MITAISALFVFLLSPVLIKNTRMVSHDTLWFYGVFHFFADSLMNGIFPFWDPYNYCGQPFYPNLSIMHLLNPMAVGMIFLGGKLKASIFSIFQWNIACGILFSALGVYMLARKINKSVFAATAVFFIFLFSSYGQIVLRQAGFLYAFLWLPWAMFFLVKFIEKGRVRDAVGLGFFMGMAMNGYQGLYAVIFVTVFILSLAVNKKAFLVSALKAKWPHLALALVIAGFLSLPLLSVFVDRNDYIPMARLRTSPDQTESFTNRTGSVPGELNDFKGLFDRRVAIKGYFEPRMELSEGFMYVGLLPLLFAFIGIVFSRNAFRLNFLVTLVFLFFIYLGGRGGVQHAVNFLFPPFRFVRHMQLFAPYILFNLAVFSGFGIEWITGKIGRPAPRAAVLGLASVIIFADLFSYGRASLEFVTMPRLKWDFSEQPAGVSFDVRRADRFVNAIPIRYFKPLLYKRPTVFNSASIPAELSEKQLKFNIYQLFAGVDDPDGFAFSKAAQTMPMASFLEYGINAFPGWDRQSKFAFLDIIEVFAIETLRSEEFYSVFDGAIARALAVRNLTSVAYQQLSIGNRDWVFRRKVWEILKPLVNLDLKFKEDAISRRYDFFGKNVDFTNRTAYHMMFLKMMSARDYLENVWNLNHVEEFTLVIKKNYRDMISLPYDIKDKTDRRRVLGNVEKIGGVRWDILSYFPRAKFVSEGEIAKIITGPALDRDTLYCAGELSAASGADKGRVGAMAYTVESYAPGYLRLGYTSTGDGYIYYSDSYDKYWRAFVDGRRTDVLKAYGVFKGISVPEGSHMVTFVYDPVFFKFSLMAYYSCIAVCGMFWVWCVT